MRFRIEAVRAPSEYKKHRVAIGSLVGPPRKTRGFLLCQAQVAVKAIEEHPEKHLIIRSDRIILDYRLPVVRNAATQTREFSFRDRCHRRQFYPESVKIPNESKPDTLYGRIQRNVHI